jgi:leucyl-tRNA synthetase
MVVHETYRDASGNWVSPAEIRIVEEDGTRKAVRLDDNAPVEIGPIEKMSKSKKNTVDPTDILETYGADTARWFVLSDSPPERDVIWTEAGVEGASRFVQRLWRLVQDALRLAAPQNAPRPAEFGPEATALRKAAHTAIARVDEDVERLRFNRCVAHLYELANAFSAALQTPVQTADFAWAVREAAETLVRLVSPMMPHLAEECWHALGHAEPVALAAWPEADPALLARDSIVLPVQINGKKRDEISVAADASNADIEAAVRQLDSVLKAIGDKPIRKVIVVPQRIVNVVA